MREKYSARGSVMISQSSRSGGRSLLVSHVTCVGHTHTE